jgi:hypothetical protein
MSYRAESIGGELKTEPSSTGGTRVICVVPVAKLIGPLSQIPCDAHA